MSPTDSAVIITLLTEISSRLSSLEDKVAAMEALYNKREKKAARQARYRAQKEATVDATEATVDADEATVDAEKATVDAGLKRKEGEREIPPQTPLIEKGGEKEKFDNRASTRAREGESALLPDELVESINRPPNAPTQKDIDEWYKLANKKLFTPEIIRDWYEARAAMGWRDIKFNKPILNWRGDLVVWARNYNLFKKFEDPGRIPDARAKASTNTKRRKADNWHGSTTYKVENVI